MLFLVGRSKFDQAKKFLPKVPVHIQNFSRPLSNVYESFQSWQTPSKSRSLSVFLCVPGLDAELYYVRDDDVNMYALSFIPPIPSDISTLYFSWHSKNKVNTYCRSALFIYNVHLHIGLYIYAYIFLCTLYSFVYRSYIFPILHNHCITLDGQCEFDDWCQFCSIPKIMNMWICHGDKAAKQLLLSNLTPFCL